MAIQATPRRRNSRKHGLSAWTAGRSGCEILSNLSNLSFPVISQLPNKKFGNDRAVQSEQKMGTTAIESFLSVELINEVVQSFKMTCRFFQICCLCFHIIFFLSSTSLVLHGKGFLSWLHQVCAPHRRFISYKTRPPRRPPKARRRGRPPERYRGSYFQ